MTNGRTYHQETRYTRSEMSGGALDWQNQPAVKKHYPGCPIVRLHTGDDLAGDPALYLSDVTAPVSRNAPRPPIDLRELSDMLTRCCCPTARARHPDGWFYFRSTASAGALYPSEIYIGAHGVENLMPGIYHYEPCAGHLSRIRQGNFDAFAAGAAGALPTREIALTLWVTGIFFRSSWKYRRRAYRYVLLDAGHVLANMLLSLRSLGRTVSWQENFDDDPVNQLLGVDPDREACLACIHVLAAGKKSETSKTSIDPPAAEILAASRVAAREHIDAAIVEVHRTGSNPVAQTPHPPPAPMFEGESGPGRPIVASTPAAGETGYLASLTARRSRRNFVQREMSAPDFHRFLDLICRYWHFDPGPAKDIVQLGLLPANVEGYDSVLHRIDRAQGAVFPTDGFASAHQSAAVCLDQDWLRQAAIHLLVISDLAWVERRFGPRGYRYAMLQAGRLGQMIYLAATSVGIGCCGIGAFYDSEANVVFRLKPAASLLYLIAAGPVKRF